MALLIRSELLKSIVGVPFEKVDLVEAERKLLLPVEHVLLKLLKCESRDLRRHVLGVVQKLLELAPLSVFLRLGRIYGL